MSWRKVHFANPNLFGRLAGDLLAQPAKKRIKTGKPRGSAQAGRAQEREKPSNGGSAGVWRIKGTAVESFRKGASMSQPSPRGSQHACLLRAASLISGDPPCLFCLRKKPCGPR